MTTPRAMTMTTYLTFDRRSSVPFYRQIYDAVRASIVAGRLRAGERLPSTRALATELGISRLPVVVAFEQLLHEGYLEGRTGSGTYVAASIPDELTTVARKPAVAEKKTRPAEAPRLGPFRVSLPALDQFPRRLWSRLVGRHAKSMTPEQMAYGDPAGHAPLRAAIADYLRTARAVHCEAGDVLIVSGSQMALQICAQVLLPRGSSVAVEEPGYPGARDALTRAGATLVPVAVDGEGLDVDALDARQNIRAVYVTPSHQYPLGMSMTASRRIALLEWARRRNAWIIEDDYDSEYRYASRPLGALQGMDTAARVIYLGSFSKVLFPSLRVGYVVVPPELMTAFLREREAIDLFSPILEQLVLTDFLAEGHLARHVRRMRLLYEQRRDALVRGLREHAHLEPYNTDAGLHVTAFLPRGMDDRELVRAAMQRGLDPVALSTCYLGRRPKSGLILGFGGTSERRLLTACRTLGELL
ncbi:MAG TPA: PLP-dependent aminotransferase family protein [Thermoanaerobaculia bacterium]|jgi:GntR family transcriptional regulator/MocR family aminotransferase